MTFPFHSCPTEILQTIFEYVALSGNKQTKSSIILSHVCWSWRRTALATPRLWATIILELNRPSSVINSIWDEMTKRAGSLPLVIEIEAGQFPFRDSLPHNFQHAQSIKSLSLIAKYFNHWEDRLYRLQEIEELAFPIPRCSIEHLEIECNLSVGYVSSWALDSWLKKWPSVQSIKISAGLHVHFEDKQPLSNIKSLSLNAYRDYSLHDINTIFPNLNMLALSKIPPHDSSPTIRFPYLKNLYLGNIQGESKIAWDTISCPNLVTLDIPVSRQPPSLYRFLQSHPSIKHLKLYFHDQDSFSHISESAPQVTSLQLNGILALASAIDWVGSNASPIFPNLEELLIYDGQNHDRIERFNSLVAARCLPIQHPECRRIQEINKQLKTLVIRVLIGYPPSSWISSHLLSSVKDMTVIKIQDQANTTRYELQWNEDKPFA